MRAAGLLLVALVLGGCSKGGDGGASEAPPAPAYALEGVVLDPAIKPVAGALVKVLETNANTTTDADGRYQFDELPRQQPLILVAQKDGYRSAAAQVTVPLGTAARLNFTLDPLPAKTPYRDVLEFHGIIQCQLATAVSGNNDTYECGAPLGEQDQWEFSVGPDFAGAVVEMFWDAITPAADSMGMRLDSLNLGELNLNLGEVVGTTGLRITVPNSVAVKYYPEGGQMRMQAFAAANNDENEVGVGASFTFQQTFDVYASIFYVVPPDPAYSIANQG